MKHKDGLDIAALLLLLLVAIAAMVVPVALTQPALLAVPAVLVLIALCVVLYQRRRLRAFLARQLCSTDFENLYRRESDPMRYTPPSARVSGQAALQHRF